MPDKRKLSKTENLQNRVSDLYKENSDLTDKTIIYFCLTIGFGVLLLISRVTIIEKNNQINDLEHQKEYLDFFKKQIEEKNDGRYKEQKTTPDEKFV